MKEKLKTYVNCCMRTAVRMFILAGVLTLCACDNGVWDDRAKTAARQQMEQLRDDGLAARQNSRFDEAIKFHSEELKLAKLLGDSIEVVKAMNNIATNYRRLGILDKAAQYHYQALMMTLRDQHQDNETVKKNKLVSLNGLGNVYMTMGDYVQADSIFRVALAGEKELNSARGQAINLSNIGTVMEKQGQYDSAMIYHRYSLAMNRQAGSKLGEALCFIHFARLHELQNNFQEAIGEYQHAIDVMADSPDDWHKLEATISQTKLFIQMGDNAAARKNLEVCDATARRIQSMSHRSDVHMLYYQIYEKEGNLRAALNHYIESSQLKDSVFDSKKVNDIQNMRISMEQEEQQNLLDQTHEKYMFELIMLRTLSVLLMVLLIVAVVYIVRLRKQIPGKKS
jgi:tetratricopeptide (TPR) repeat protein